MSPPEDSTLAVPKTGIDTIRDFAKALPNAPGVYRMMNAGGDVLYVGKARSLKKRVTTYTQPAKLPDAPPGLDDYAPAKPAKAVKKASR